MAKLRRFKLKDANIYHKIAHSSEDIARYVPNLVRSELFLTRKLVDEFANVDFFTKFAFLVCDKNWEPIGAIYAFQEPAYNALNVSYFLAKDYRRLGLMKDALNLFISYCKNCTPYESLFFDVLPENTESQMLVNALGTHSIGTFEDIFIFERNELLLN